MKKRVKGRTFSRKRDQRKALLLSLMRNLFEYGKIKTTEAKAKEVSRFADKIIAKAKKGDLHSIRQVAEHFDRAMTNKIVNEIAKSLSDRNSGFTRVIKIGRRQSDGAEMAIIEIIKKQ